MSLLRILTLLLLTPCAHAVTLVQFASGFTKPIAILDDPLDGGNRKFVVEKGGVVKIVDGSTGKVTGTFLDLSSIVTEDVNEGGLLGLAFHPDYKTNRFLFVNYTTRINGQLYTVIRRLRCDATDPNTVPVGNTANETVLKFKQPYDNHNGGQIVFSPIDKMLYIGTGDGGSGGDPLNNGQKLSTFLGKMLRINVSTDADLAGYDIPSDNPFANVTSGRKKEILHYGLRNPWRFSFDRDTGDLFIGDVGQNTFEEIDYAENGAKGYNFGWRLKEANRCYLPSKNCLKNGTIKVKNPICVYRHSLGCSVTGGYRYRGSAIPSLEGKYMYADFCYGTIWAATKNDTTSKWSCQVLMDRTENPISSFGEKNDGELYVVSLDGKIYELSDS